ncbi:SRPBCC domain-containing protein [Streptomyces sp. NBC_01520]|uniref:SRPBCC domain-containing protein n=1 Tax=Streptomyces sp. NBC_01520 TaxID=2903892 RepID=UPI0038640813
MEHEVFVPVPVASLRRALGDPARVARCVPGLQQDADASAGPLAGRLKIRIDGHTITYRGALTLADRGGDAFSVTGEGVEARGAGAVELALTVGLTQTDGGTTIAYTGSASGDGRIVELDEEAAFAAARRLLDRFTQQLVTESLAARDGEEPASGPAPDAAAEPTRGPVPDAAEPTPGPVPDASPDPASGPVPDAAAEPTRGPVPDAAPDPAPDAASDEAPAVGKESVFDAPVPPPSLDPSAELEFTVPDVPPAEAAHARRTMIGRSTEEVDHAPPRGRYSPVPSPEAGAAGIALRWAAPAAALVIASAVVVGRALRRRR